MQTSNRCALKEWAVVVKALTAGRQLILLRKGGVEDPDGAFHLEHPEFFLYPTFEHQQREFVREKFLPDFDAAIREQAAEGKLALNCYAEVADVLRVSDLESLRRLTPYHLWTDAFLETRLRYKPQVPLRVVIVRAYAIPPLEIAVRGEYAGCKSWVELDREYPVSGARPVLDTAAFARRTEDLRARLMQ